MFEEEFLLAAPVTHSLSKLKAIQQHHLDHKNLLLLEEGHCLRDQALAVCHRMHASETQDFRATSLETLRHMVSAGVGITLMPKLACHSSDTIAYVPFQQPKPVRSIGFYFRNHTAKKVLLSSMVDDIKSILLKQKLVKIIN